MEFCENGELFNQIVKKRKMDENESAYYYFQLINGLQYIHSKNIVHRDLKPENLLINKKNILKIIDFGLSNYYKDNNFLSTPCGSPCYASPEMIAGKKYDGNLIDVWSSGIILFAMLCGYLPFDGLSNEILFKKILKCKIEYPKYLSNTAIDLLKKILVNEPKNRITISEIKKHPFYLKGREEFKKLILQFLKK
jgi:5'-AMP-activated protein kinase catalytic alpha subunit